VPPGPAQAVAVANAAQAMQPTAAARRRRTDLRGDFNTNEVECSVVIDRCVN
jgi:hypothetical protein